MSNKRGWLNCNSLNYKWWYKNRHDHIWEKKITVRCEIIAIKSVHNIHSIKTWRKHRNVNFCPHVMSDNCVILFALLKFAYRLRHRAFTTSWFCGNPGTWLPKIRLKSVMASEGTVCLLFVLVISKCLWRTQVTSELHEMRNHSH